MTLSEYKIDHMTNQRFTMVKLRGLGPYTIDRVEGEVEVQSPIGLYMWRRWVNVRAYDLRLPDGKSRRFSRLIDAKAYVRMLLATAGKGVTT